MREIDLRYKWTIFLCLISGFIFSCKSKSSINDSWKRFIAIQINNLYSFQQDTVNKNIHIVKDPKNSSNIVYHFKKGEEFGGIIFEGKVEKPFLLTKEIDASVRFFPLRNACDASLVCIIKDENGKTKFWQSKRIYNEVAPKKWITLNANFKINLKLDTSNKLVLYIWNKGRDEIYYDDFRTTIITKDTLMKRFYGAYSAQDSNLTHFRNGAQIYRVEKFEPVTNCMQNIQLSDNLLYAVKDENKDGLDELLVKNKENQISTFQYNTDKKEFIKSKMNFPDNNIKWYSLDKIYNNNILQVDKGHFVYSNYPRFNLLYIFQKDTFKIKFLKDKEQIRPKYYEVTLILTGHFTQKNKQEILTFFCNVNNEKYNGNNDFGGLQEIKGLPNGAKIYRIENE